MSSAARNPLAAQRRADEEARAAVASKPAVQRAAVQLKKAAKEELQPTRSSARVQALQEEKAQRRLRSSEPSHSEHNDDDEDEEEEEEEEACDDGKDYVLSLPNVSKSHVKKKRKGRGWHRQKQAGHHAHGPPPPPTPRHEFLATLASFSRIGFDPWRVVQSHHIPAMTYEGYVALAYDSLEPATRAAIRDSQPYEAEQGETYHDDPWPLIYGQTPSPLSLYRRVDRVYGREEYRVCASRRIAAKEVVAFLAGRLTEQSKALKERREDEHQHFFMERSYLHQFFGYEGPHSLMLSTKEYRSLASYIRDPCEKTDGEDANIKVDVTLDTVTGLFFVVLYAAADVARGEELHCLPFLGRFLSRAHRQMFLYARISHWHHRYATMLERALLAHPEVQWDRRVPPSISSQPLTAEMEAKHYGDEDARSLVYQVSVEEGYLQWGVVDALGAAHCQYAKVAFLGEEVGEEVKEAMRRVPDWLPDTVTIKGEKVKVDSAGLERLVQEGHDWDMLEVREDRCIGSPVRYFDVPTRPSFCVMAKRRIEPGTFVFTYAGEISEVVKNNASAYGQSPPHNSRPLCPSYIAPSCLTHPLLWCVPVCVSVYNLLAADIRRAVPQYVDVPDLYLDAASFGNVARFVNDNRYRLSEEGAPGSSANLDCTFLMHHGVVHLGFYVTRPIEPSEELVSQYGDDYWKTVQSRLIDEHKDYYDYASTYIHHMTHTLQQHRLPLPAKPEYCVEQYRLFEHKPEPYPDWLGGSGGGGHGLDEGEEEERYEVSQVLDHHPKHAPSAAYVTHYLVQWTGYDGNTWESVDNLDGCSKVIDNYFELRRLERSKKRNGRVTGPWTARRAAAAAAATAPASQKKRAHR